MRIASLLAIAGLIFGVPSVSARPETSAAHSIDAVADFVTEAAHRFAIPEAWIYAVIRVESGGNAHAVSPKGAAGLMQIMPGTWRQLRARYALGDDIYDPHDNIIAGAGYLRALYDRYGSPGCLAAYNAGPARYETYLARGVDLPVETIRYVRKLAPVAAGKGDDAGWPAAADPAAWTRSALFPAAPRDPVATSAKAGSLPKPAIDGVSPTAQAGTTLPGSNSLFVPLSSSPRP